MSKFALIDTETNICNNIIVWNESEQPLWTPPVGHYLVNIDNLIVGIDYLYDKNNDFWTAPPSMEESQTENILSVNSEIKII
jgi:hypothetical protein